MYIYPRIQIQMHMYICVNTKKKTAEYIHCTAQPVDKGYFSEVAKKKNQKKTTKKKTTRPLCLLHVTLSRDLFLCGFFFYLELGPCAYCRWDCLQQHLCAYACKYVCVLLRMRVWMRVCKYVYAYVCCRWDCLQQHLCVYMRVNTCACYYVYAYECVCVMTYTRT